MRLSARRKLDKLVDRMGREKTNASSCPQGRIAVKGVQAVSEVGAVVDHLLHKLPVPKAVPQTFGNGKRVPYTYLGGLTVFFSSTISVALSPIRLYLVIYLRLHGRATLKTNGVSCCQRSKSPPKNRQLTLIFGSYPDSHYFSRIARGLTSSHTAVPRQTHLGEADLFCHSGGHVFDTPALRQRLDLLLQIFSQRRQGLLHLL